MDREQAKETVRQIDEEEREARAARLMELTELLPPDRSMGFHGQAAQWLFNDVKATWIYGCFTATVLAAYDFCRIQLAAVLRELPDEERLPVEPVSLDELAAAVAAVGTISTDLHAQLVNLNDRVRAYQDAPLRQYRRELEQHLIETEMVTDEHPLLLDARQAITTAVAVLLRSY